MQLATSVGPHRMHTASIRNVTALLRPVDTKTLYTISKLFLSKDVLHIVKSYCFYNEKDSRILNAAKCWKQMTNSLILQAMSRNMHSFENHWVFGFPSGHATEHLQLQAENCVRCGKYITLSNDEHLFPQHIFCRC